jgi:hypothetical protein
MDISISDIKGHFEGKTYPSVDQALNIIQKYQIFTSKTADLSQKFKAVELNIGDYNIGVNFPQDELVFNNEKTIEIRIFDEFIRSKKIKELLAEIGISADSYEFLYDYVYVNTYREKSCELDQDLISVVFKRPRILIVLFEESSYNLLRLVWKKTDDSLILEFDTEFL